MARRVAPWLTGALALLALATVAPAVPFTLPEPLSAGHALLVLAFVATLLAALPSPIGDGRRRPAFVAAHLAVTGLALALHPMTLLGRDGTALVLAAHLFTVLWLLTRVRAEAKLAATSAFVGLLVSETLLARVPAPRAPEGVLDYHELMLADEKPGALQPGLDVRVVTEHGTGRFVTDSHGYRNATEVSPLPAAGAFRVLLLGDSFATGYRVDQAEFLGPRLERELRSAQPEAEVIVIGTGHPGYAREVLEREGLLLRPSAVVLGLTLANDLQVTWAVARGLAPPALEDFGLPEDAYRGRLALLPLALDRSLSSWRSYRRLVSLLRPDTIAAWYRDVPRGVHLFDPAHGLGFHYTRRPIPVVEASLAAGLDALAAMRRACDAAGVRFVVAVFPQRFQVSAREWPATLWERGLDQAAFDVEAPNRALAEGCRARGVECVDLLPELRRACQGEAPCYLPRGDMHWNARGHAVAAAALARALTP